MQSTTQVFVVQVVGGIFSILTNLFLAWALGPAGKGATALLVVVPGFIVIATNLGLYISMVYLVAKDKYPYAEILSTTLSATLAISLVLALLGALAFPLLLQFVFVDIPPAFVLISLTTLPSYLLALYFGDILWAMKYPGYYMVIRLLPVLIYFLGALILVGWGKYQVLGATVAFALGIHSSGIAAYLLAGRTANLRLAFNRSLFSEAIRYGLKAYSGNLAQQSTYRLDLPIVNYFAGLGAAGYYSFAVTLAETLWYIPRSIGYALFVRVAKSDRSEADRITPLMIRSALFISCLAAIAFFVASNYLVSLLLPAYQPAIPLLLVLLPGLVVTNVFQVIVNDLLGRGQPMLSTLIAWAGLGSSVILYFTLIPPLGAMGAAIASTVVYTLEAMVAVVVLSRTANLSVRTLLLPNREDVGIYRTLQSRMQRFISSLVGI